MLPVGIVTPWFGADPAGGAWRRARDVAAGLAGRGHDVEVLTTCCQGPSEDWGENHLPARLGSEGGLAVRRFPVDPRDRAAFDRVRRRLLAPGPADLKPGVSPLSAADAETFVRENLNSATLVEYLRRNGAAYRALLFFGCGTGPVLSGLPVAADRAFLWPDLRGDAHEYLPQAERVVRSARGLLFDSEADAALAARLYGPGVWPRAAVVGGTESHEAALGLVDRPAGPPARPARGLREVHQLLPSLSYGDAISDHVLAVRDRLTALGYRSKVIALHTAPRIADQAEVFRPGCLPAAAGLLYHHAIGSGITAEAVRHPGPKCLVYHNITPAHFFAPFRPDHADILARGRADLPRLAPHFPLSVGVSAFNAAELRDCGFADPGVLPIAVEPGKWNVPADPGLMRLLQDGQTNLLFVGRIAPNKCQHHLVEAFAHYRSLDPTGRLILVGGHDPGDPYPAKVLAAADLGGVGDRVVVTGHVTSAQLAAYYRTAHLFWSMSEHEGLCVPLIEAMWFDVPVLAYRSTAIPESLGASRVLFTDKRDLRAVAGLAAVLVRDRAVRETVLRAQRERRRAFLPDAVWKAFDVVLESLERQHEEGRVRRAAVRA